MLALGFGYIKIISNDDTILNWPIVYTPQSNGTVLSPDNYCQHVEKADTAIVQMSKSTKFGSMNFHSKTGDILTTLQLQQTSNGEWVMINKIMRQNNCQITKSSIITEIIPTRSLNQNQTFKASVSAVLNSSPNTFTTRIEHKYQRLKWHKLKGNINIQLIKIMKMMTGMYSLKMKTSFLITLFNNKRKWWLKLLSVKSSLQ